MQLSPIPPQVQAPIVISEERAAYRITEAAGFYGSDDTLYKENEMIYWDDTPALCMEPLNKKAREAKAALIEKLDTLGKEAAEKAGKSYTSYEQAHDNAIAIERLNSKQVQVIGAPKQKQLMGDPNKGVGKVQAITAGSEVPMTGGGKHTGKLSLNNAGGDTGLEGKTS